MKLKAITFLSTYSITHKGAALSRRLTAGSRGVAALHLHSAEGYISIEMDDGCLYVVDMSACAMELNEHEMGLNEILRSALAKVDIVPRKRRGRPPKSNGTRDNG